MMVIWGDFLELVELYRAVWISGRYGGGKTCLAYALARAVAHNRQIVCNIPAAKVLRRFPLNDVGRPQCSESIVLLDEAADHLDPMMAGSQNLLPAFRYARHQDIVYIFPSIDMIQKRLRKLIVRSWMDLSFVLFGLFRVFLYRWWVGPELDPPFGKKSRFTAHGWILMIPSKRDWEYTSVHAGKGLTTSVIIRQLLSVVKELDNEE